MLRFELWQSAMLDARLGTPVCARLTMERPENRVTNLRYGLAESLSTAGAQCPTGSRFSRPGFRVAHSIGVACIYL